MDHRSAGLAINGQCARPAALNGPAAEVAEGNALVAEAAFPSAVEAAFPKAAVADQIEENAAEKEANTTGDFDFDMSDSDRWPPARSIFTTARRLWWQQSLPIPKVFKRNRRIYDSSGLFICVGE